MEALGIAIFGAWITTGILAATIFESQRDNLGDGEGIALIFLGPFALFAIILALWMTGNKKISAKMNMIVNFLIILPYKVIVHYITFKWLKGE